MYEGEEDSFVNLDKYIFQLRQIHSAILTKYYDFLRNFDK